MCILPGEEKCKEKGEGCRLQEIGCYQRTQTLRGEGGTGRIHGREVGQRGRDVVQGFQEPASKCCRGGSGGGGGIREEGKNLAASVARQSATKKRGEEVFKGS